MEKYFDSFLYYANWGTHILKLRLPSALLDLNTIQSYCNGDQFSARQDFESQNEDGGEWEEGLRLAPFLSLRTDLIRGDRRCRMMDEEDFEPSVPPGLQNLNLAH